MSVDVLVMYQEVRLSTSRLNEFSVHMIFYFIASEILIFIILVHNFFMCKLFQFHLSRTDFERFDKELSTANRREILAQVAKNLPMQCKGKGNPSIYLAP
jgi:hypothetical protein